MYYFLTFDLYFLVFVLWLVRYLCPGLSSWKFFLCVTFWAVIKLLQSIVKLCWSWSKFSVFLLLHECKLRISFLTNFNYRSHLVDSNTNCQVFFASTSLFSHVPLYRVENYTSWSSQLYLLTKVVSLYWTAMDIFTLSIVLHASMGAAILKQAGNSRVNLWAAWNTVFALFMTARKTLCNKF